MKKVLTFVLTVIMVMSLAIPAAALPSTGAKVEDLTPVLTKPSQAIVRLIPTEEIHKESEEIQNEMAEAKENLAKARPKRFAVKYFFYVDIIGNETTVTIDFEPIKIVDENKLVVMQFIDEEWVEIKFTINEDGTITVYNVVEGPIAFFVMR